MACGLLPAGCRGYGCRESELHLRAQPAQRRPFSSAAARMPYCAPGRRYSPRRLRPPCLRHRSALSRRWHFLEGHLLLQFFPEVGLRKMIGALRALMASNLRRTESSQTLSWRKPDSNRRYRATRRSHGGGGSGPRVSSDDNYPEGCRRTARRPSAHGEGSCLEQRQIARCVRSGRWRRGGGHRYVPCAINAVRAATKNAGLPCLVPAGRAAA